MCADRVYVCVFGSALSVTVLYVCVKIIWAEKQTKHIKQKKKRQKERKIKTEGY